MRSSKESDVIPTILFDSIYILRSFGLIAALLLLFIWLFYSLIQPSMLNATWFGFVLCFLIEVDYTQIMQIDILFVSIWVKYV